MRHDDCMGGKEYHTDGTEWPWRIFTLAFNEKLWGDIVGAQFLKICSALRVPQLENTVIKEKQNSRSTTREPHDTVMKCVTDSRTHVDYSQREKESGIIIVQGLAFISATILRAVWSLMLKQN